MKRKSITEYSNLSRFLLLVIFILIIYLIIACQRLKESFGNNNIKDNNTNADTFNNIYIKKEVNPFDIQKVWEGVLNGKHISFWQKKSQPEQDYYSFGQTCVVGDKSTQTINEKVLAESSILHMLLKGGKFPITYLKIWSSDMMSGDKPTVDLSIWQPIPPEGYVAMGDIVSPTLSAPARFKTVCFPKELLKQNQQFKKTLHTQEDLGIWSVGNYNTFIANNSSNQPSNRQTEIMDISNDLMSRKQPDPNENYKSLQVTLSTLHSS